MATLDTTEKPLWSLHDFKYNSKIQCNTDSSASQISETLPIAIVQTSHASHKYKIYTYTSTAHVHNSVVMKRSSPITPHWYPFNRRRHSSPHSSVSCLQASSILQLETSSTKSKFASILYAFDSCIGRIGGICNRLHCCDCDCERARELQCESER